MLGLRQFERGQPASAAEAEIHRRPQLGDFWVPDVRVIATTRELDAPIDPKPCVAGRLVFKTERFMRHDASHRQNTMGKLCPYPSAAVRALRFYEPQ